jgi:hypothetical protein
MQLLDLEQGMLEQIREPQAELRPHIQLLTHSLSVVLD